MTRNTSRFVAVNCFAVAVGLALRREMPDLALAYVVLALIYALFIGKKKP